MLNRATMEPKRLTLQSIEESTNGFSDERKLGQGAYGKVYMGVSADGEEIAVKVLHDVNLELDDSQFQNEFRTLMMLQHENIVQFVGYCYETQHKPLQYNGRIIFAEKTYRALCFEYLHLSDESDGLDWHTRYKIIKGTCEGLKYLHEGFKEPIYHLDLKPDNILLDRNMVPKLADFGLSRMFGEEQTRITNSPIGTFGYLPMEYLEGNIVSNKLDIYSLGVVMTKIIAGPMGRTKSVKMNHREFIDLVEGNWRNRLQGFFRGSSLQAYCQQVKKCIEIALDCVEHDRHKRPKIMDIIMMLNETETEIGKAQLLSVQPLQLRFPLQANTSRTTCLLHLTNNTDGFVVFRLVTKSTECLIRHCCGIVPPSSSCYTLAITMRNQQKLHSNSSECFTLEASIAGDLDIGTIVADRFFMEANEKEREVHQVNLTAVYVHCEIISQGNRKDTIYSIDLHPDKPWILTGHCNSTTAILDFHTQETVCSFGATEQPRARSSKTSVILGLFPQAIYASTYAVVAAKFVGRKQWFVAGYHNGNIAVYCYDRARKVNSFKAHEGRVTSLDIHPTQSYVLSASSDDCKVKLWDWEKCWACIRTFDSHGQVTDVKFNPMDANKFVSVSSRGAAKIWNISSSLSETTISGIQGATTLDFFTHTGQLYLLTTCYRENTARIWDFDSGTCVEVLNGHTNWVNAVCSHPDLPVLITGSDDGTVRLWNSTTFRLEGILNCGLGVVKAISCLKGSKRIVIGHADGLAVTEI